MENKSSAASSKLCLPWFMVSQNVWGGKTPYGNIFWARPIQQRNMNTTSKPILELAVVFWHTSFPNFCSQIVHIIKFTQIILWHIEIVEHLLFPGPLRLISTKGLEVLLLQDIRKEYSFSSCPLRKHWSFIRTKNINSLLRQIQPGLLLTHHMGMKIN